jgi:hypothetical protein
MQMQMDEFGHRAQGDLFGANQVAVILLTNVVEGTANLFTTVEKRATAR